MLNLLKRKVREWEQAGRYPLVTRGLTYIWVQLHNFRDRMFIGRVPSSLSEGTFPVAVEQAVTEILNGKTGKGVRPMQVPSELTRLIELVQSKSPKTVLEIGTARGGTLLLLCRFAAPDATIISIDLPYARNGGGYPRWKEKIYRSFAGKEQTLHLLRANSHLPETREQVDAILQGRTIDFMLIDADHSYEGVKTDYEMYSALASEGGIVALHDVLVNTTDPSIDVNRFWKELEANDALSTETIYGALDQGHSGIGVVRT